MFKTLFLNIQTRLKGDTARANAQLGLVNAPEGNGKLIWLVAGHTYDSVLMAVTLLAAIREKRLDVRLVLTYQTEYQELIIRHLSGLKKIGFGFGCGESQFAANKILTRLNPFAILFIGDEPHSTLVSAIENKTMNHLIAFQYKPVYTYSSIFYEACYPDDMEDDAYDGKSCHFISQSFNVMSRLVQTQVDKQLGAMLCGSESRALYHVHNLSDVNEMLICWKKSPLSKNNLLTLSFPSIDRKKIATLKESIHTAGFSSLLLSQWKQDSVSPESIIIVDDKKWFAAICSSAIATHLFQTDSSHFWQAVSSGGSISRDKHNLKVAKTFMPLLTCHQSLEKLIEHWLLTSKDTIKQRSQSDAIRKVFWSERRMAEEQTNALLQRVFDW